MTDTEPRVAHPALFRLPNGLDTPCLVVDVERVAVNAARMAEAARSRGVALRPHIKTHKSVALARLQLEAGATGLTVGTLGEAEVMVEAGLDDVFVAYPIWADGPKAARLRELLATATIAVGIDNVVGAHRLAEAAAGAGHLQVLVEVDPGNRRTGVASPAEAVRVAEAARHAGLQVIGVFAHGGHSYHGPGSVAGAAADEVASLGSAASAMTDAGFEVARVSAGSTPTATLVAGGVVNEIRPGTYLLGDRQQVALGAIPPDGVALVVAATVVSDAVPGQVVIDAGAKTLTKDRASFLEGYGAIPAYREAVIERVADYHGVVRIPDGSPSPHVGEVLAIIPNHVCPVIEQFDELIAVSDGAIVARWPVDARGRSR